MAEHVKLVREKKHRLAEKLYEGPVTAAFTICLMNRSKLFVDETIINKFKEVLLAEATKFNCEVLVYQFMPDHLHLILQGKDEYSGLLNLVKLFKQKTGYWLSKNHPLGRWQKDFYDHLLRKDEDLTKQIQYILENYITV